MKTALTLAFALSTPLAAEPILLQSTTSTQGSGLYDHILPIFTKDTGIDVRVLAVGTGQALRNAQNCDADLLLVHAKEAEDAFVAQGYGLERFDVMYNDFVIIGPEDDPARLSNAASAVDALTLILQNEAKFTSRGDDSGTHKAERRLWAQAGQSPDARDDKWYLETGSGMGATLNIAVSIGAYTMTDRSTWMRFGNRNGADILFENDPVLFNQYGLVSLNPEHCPNANHTDAARFQNWILGAPGQAAIASYRIDGQQVFFPNARP